jgi:hypothetical protein
MPFIKRDQHGAVVAVHHQPVEEGLEEVAAEHPDLARFLHKTLLDFAVNRTWIESDLSMVRVVEDVVDMLIDRKVFLFMDLPEPVQRKFLERRGLRAEFAYMDTLFGDQESFEVNEHDEGSGYL